MGQVYNNLGIEVKSSGMSAAAMVQKMTKEPARSTTFRSERDLSKSEQEQRVGELFAEAYEQTTGIKLKGNIRGGDPPDRLFFYQGLTIGVELFELGQFYKPRALLSDLTDRVYSEFQSRGDSKRYEGIRIDVPILTDIETAEALRTRWQQKGIEIKQKSTFVKELVNLLVENVPSRDTVPKEGRVIPVNPRLYPAVSALTEKIIIRRCPISTTLRTDGKAAPLVIMSSGYHITGSEIGESIENKIAKKVKGGAKWKSAVEHSVLVAHDIPRGRIYEGFVFRREAPKWLRSAASRTHLLQIFDELWFVTPFKFEVDAGGKKIRTKAQRICGRELKQYSGYLAL